MNSFVYHKYMSRGEMLSIYIPDALTIAVYFTRLLKGLYLASAALIKFLSFLWKVLPGGTQLRGRGRCESWAAEKSCKCKPRRKKWNVSWVCWQPITNQPSGEHLIPIYHLEVKALTTLMLMGLTVSLPIFYTKIRNYCSFTTKCFSIFYQNHQPFHTKLVKVLLKLTACLIQS